jgi:hypothetical protein
MANRKKILFIVGSPNQTNQMYKISTLLEDTYECWFSQFYPDYAFEKFALRKGWLDTTIMAGTFKAKADKFIADHGLRNDYMAAKNNYDMTLFCTDLIVPRKLRAGKKIWVQEGMIDRVDTWSKFVKASRIIPPYFALGTSLNGSRNKCDIYCAGSEGYKNFISKMGTQKDKIAVTGIINYDDIYKFLNNDFPHRHYVMVATSDIRECYGHDDRFAFLEECVKKANGRQMLFKLHPNEEVQRAVSEIKAVAPANSLIYTTGNADHMVANCDELITQWSTLGYVGIVLGKKVNSFFDVEELRKLTPWQNNGTSVDRIADICRGFMEFKGTGPEFLAQYQPSRNLAAA